jgi:hypothetical protein
VAILERNFAAHFAVRQDGVVRPLCQDWRSTWNWTLERDHVTCPQCRVELVRRGIDGPIP